jgi:hypothetical protein
MSKSEPTTSEVEANVRFETWWAEIQRRAMVVAAKMPPLELLPPLQPLSRSRQSDSGVHAVAEHSRSDY